MLRQRTDKQANGQKTAENILKTILDPVEEEDLKALMVELKKDDFIINEEEFKKKRRRSESSDHSVEEPQMKRPRNSNN